MYLNKIDAYNFRNFSKLNLEFKKINIIQGKNGSGKSNLLELIYYFFSNTSFRSVTDNQILKSDENFFSIKGIFDLEEIVFKNNISINKQKIDEKFEKTLMYVINKGKTIKIDDSIKDLFFYIPVLENKTFYNILYILDFRRKFFDKVLSFLDPEFKNNLLNHNKILKIKKDFYNKIQDFKKLKNNISMLNEKLAQSIVYITNARSKFYYTFFKNISNDNDFDFDINEVKVVYKSIFKDLEFDQIKYVLDEGIEKEIKTERLYGNHVDGIYLYYKGKNITNILSLGQLKILFTLIVFKIIKILEKQNNYKPIILIDDFFVDLDKTNQIKVLKIIKLFIENNFQLFLTTLDKIDIKQYFKNENIDVDKNFKLINLDILELK